MRGRSRLSVCALQVEEVLFMVLSLFFREKLNDIFFLGESIFLTKREIDSLKDVATFPGALPLERGNLVFPVFILSFNEFSCEKRQYCNDYHMNILCCAPVYLYILLLIAICFILNVPH